MVDIITPSVEGLGSKVSAGFSTGMIYLSIALLVLGILALIFWTRYLKSFNHVVIIKRLLGDDGSYELDLGYKGRYVFKNSNEPKDQEMIFQIFQAKKNKFNYTEGTVERDLRIPLMIKGRRKYAVIFAPDKDGFLHPVKVTSKDKSMLESQISQGAIGFAAKAVDNITQKYRKQDFMQKYGLLIFLILILIIAALYWWGAKNNAEAVKSIADAVGAQAQTQSDLTRLITGLINGTVKMTPPPTVTVIT